MKKSIKCCTCEAEVEQVSIALCKKLLDKNTKKFFCLKCLADYLDITVEDLLEKAADFKAQGCTLFG